MKDQKRIEREIMELEAIIKNFQEEDEKIANAQQAANRLFREKVEYLNQEKNKAHALEQRIQSHLLEKEKIQLKLEELEREWAVLGRNAHDQRRLAEPASNVSRSDAGRPENVSIINN